jgi:hypothetical protein
MALTIATISLCLFIVLIQHLYNYMVRVYLNKMDDIPSLLVGLTVLMFIITGLSFRLLILINK